MRITRIGEGRLNKLAMRVVRDPSFMMNMIILWMSHSPPIPIKPHMAEDFPESPSINPKNRPGIAAAHHGITKLKSQAVTAINRASSMMIYSKVI